MSIEWVPVKTSLPLMTCVVAVVISNGASTIWCKALYSRDGGFESICSPLDGVVTHWALVELP